jgi:hypothetical protein
LEAGRLDFDHYPGPVLFLWSCLYFAKGNKYQWVLFVSASHIDSDLDRAGAFFPAVADISEVH